MSQRQTNWAKNFTYSAEQIQAPFSEEELQQIVSSASKVKALGSRHSFNSIADTSGELISMQHFNNVLSIDTQSRTVTVQGGIRYGELCIALDREGFALHNLASLPHISVAGACATATHGSGNANGNLATAVVAMKLITADGSVITVSQNTNDALFKAATVGLGAFGFVTDLTLKIEPRYEMTQHVYDSLPVSELLMHFEEIESLGYSVSLFTDWSSDRMQLLWVKRRCDVDYEPLPNEILGATKATGERHPIAGLDPVNCTPQLGVPGPWFDRLPHFRLGFTPSSGEELQTEYLVSRRFAVYAIRAVAALGEQIAPLLQTSEIRTVAADELWMSPCCGRSCVAIHFTWKQKWDAVRPLLPLIEAALEPFEARPHWGKLFSTSPKRLAELFPHLSDYRNQALELDPTGKFQNEFLEHIQSALRE